MQALNCMSHRFIEPPDNRFDACNRDLRIHFGKLLVSQLQIEFWNALFAGDLLFQFLWLGLYSEFVSLHWFSALTINDIVVEVLVS